MNWKVLVSGFPGYTNLGFLGICNVIYIESDGKRFIFDPGNMGQRDKLAESLKSDGINLNDIDGIVISHMHYDHSLNSTLFRRAKVYISEREYNYCINSKDNALADFLIDILKERIIKVREGENLYGLKFIELPGHTGGTLGLMMDKTLFVGDAIKYVKEAKEGKVYSANYSLDLANKSLRKAISLAEIIVPGHDLPFKVEGKKVEAIGEELGFTLYLRGRVKVRTIEE